MGSKPWERFAWNSEHQKLIYRDWGLFYTHKQQLDIAVRYYDKSLDLEQDDAKALYFRSRCKRNIAQTDSALLDGLAAKAIDDNSAAINLEICDALYELNKFEEYKLQLHNNSRKFFGKRVGAFLNRIITIDENFKDTVGESLGPFILKNENHFPFLLQKIERGNLVESKPLWKILKEQDKCDVLSILEKEKMLHARSPMYTEQVRRCPDKKVFDLHHEAYLNRAQYNTRRTMLAQLRNIRRLRQKGNIEKLAKCVESVMGDYVVLKTHRIMPWKFEYINEVYNILALAYADSYRIDENLLEIRERDRLQVLLNLPTDKHKDMTKFVFGDKSTYQEPDATDYTLIAYKKFLTHLDKRMIFAKYSIEKCYLLHEIARAHLLQSHFEECCSYARKAAEETKNCNSKLWNFLSIMLIVKAHAILHKVERCKEALDEALTIAQQLKSFELCSFIEICCTLNDQEISQRKRRQSFESVRKRRSQSVMSRISMNRIEDAEEINAN